MRDELDDVRNKGGVKGEDGGVEERYGISGRLFQLLQAALGLLRQSAGVWQEVVVADLCGKQTWCQCGNGGKVKC